METQAGHSATWCHSSFKLTQDELFCFGLFAAVHSWCCCFFCSASVKLPLYCYSDSFIYRHSPLGDLFNSALYAHIRGLCVQTWVISLNHDSPFKIYLKKKNVFDVLFVQIYTRTVYSVLYACSSISLKLGRPPLKA